MTNRRDFLKQVATAGTTMLVLPSWLPIPSPVNQKRIPSYLWDDADLFIKDPHQAALSWFSKAGFGLFMHYGLYSLLGRGEWVQLEEKIPVAEYEQLKNKFTAHNFDADFTIIFLYLVCMNNVYCFVVGVMNFYPMVKGYI